ncbi:MAG: CDP-alcohol phosphatidyltransferase family protein [Phycisphaerae bacterium]|nr:CDP-alcohol phosphatidyltransferase family protein [Phycisphaerae bacterium]
MVILDEERQIQTEVTPARRRLIGISLLPAAATLGNLICGFLAIFCCLLSMRAEFAGPEYVFHPRLEQLFPTHIAAGAYLIILAMIFDALDGRLARITRRTSEFGAQLDSISDIVSFGVAPATLFVTLLLRPALGAPPDEPDASRLQIRAGIICVLVYLSCAAIRLARYNVENVKGEEAQRAFSGLPSPGAAAAVVALLALHEHLRLANSALWGMDWANVSRWVIALTAFSVGLLMVSRLDYVHVFNVYIRRKHPPTHLVWLIVIIGLGWYKFEALLVVLAFAYVISGILISLVRRRQDSSAASPTETSPRVDDN